MKRRYRVLLVLAFYVLAMAALVAVAYQVENVRGARAWEQARRELAAQGESLDPATFIPPPVPDGDNLAMIPLFARALDYRVNPQTHTLTFGPNRLTDSPFRDMPFGFGEPRPKFPNFGGWESGHPLELAVLQQFYAKRAGFPHPARPGTAADDVLGALARFGPVTDEIEAALAVRTQCRFPVNWLQWPPFTLALPHCNLIQESIGVYRLRALAHLEAGQHAEAAHDLATAFRLHDAIRPEPTLLAHLVVLTCDGLLLQPIWQGLAARRWTADELRAIQTQLRADDLLADYVRAVRGERALCVCRWLDGLRQTRDTRSLVAMADSDLTGSDGTTKTWLERAAVLFPVGWIDQNEVRLGLSYQQLITDVVNLPTRRVAPALLKARQRQRQEEGARFVPTAFLESIIVPVFELVVTKTARAQTACEQAEVACALERYFLERQTYPETLAELVPGFLDRVPTDLIDGRPMRYRRTDDGRFLLYGIGWNERDDGGMLAWPPSATGDGLTAPDRQEGDWCWQYRAVQPAGR